MSESLRIRAPLSDRERNRRKRYLSATLVTCAALAMFGGAIHVVKLGANRITDMRDRATYDVADVKSRLRAAGEDIHRNREAEAKAAITGSYTPAQADMLLAKETWAELDKTVLIPAGEFRMGTNSTRTDEYNRPEHSVNLPAFGIDKYPVTNAQYARFVAATGYRAPLHWKGGKIPPGLETHPVTMVSWYDANAYAEWAGKRLPTEQEWEKAARGTDARRWPWGSEMKADRLNTYYSVGSTTKVDAYPQGASPYGVLDIVGNVSEWVADDFLPYPGSKAPLDLFAGKLAVATTQVDRAMKIVDLVNVNARYKVLRGGSWKSDPFSTSVYHRNFNYPHYASDFFGFRCAADAKGGDGAS